MQPTDQELERFQERRLSLFVLQGYIITSFSQDLSSWIMLTTATQGGTQWKVCLLILAWQMSLTIPPTALVL
jgi:hypothetical protein